MKHDNSERPPLNLESVVFKQVTQGENMIVEVEAGVELASCPFCGSSAVARSDGRWNADIQKNSNATFWVKCVNSKCSVSTIASSNQAEAINRWNARH